MYVSYELPHVLKTYPPDTLAVNMNQSSGAAWPTVELEPLVVPVTVLPQERVPDRGGGGAFVVGQVAVMRYAPDAVLKPSTITK